MGVPPSTAAASSTSRPSSPAPLGRDESYTYTLQRIGTASEKQSVEKELAELRERLSRVEDWKKRADEIDAELNDVLSSDGSVVPPPPCEDRNGGGQIDTQQPL